MKKVQPNFFIPNLVLAIAIVSIEFLITAPAFAHHALGKQLPANFFQGILSGLAHPMIGFDHFAFIVASGLIAVGIAKGLFIPVTFVLATAIGTGLHLLSINLPIPELVIATSVILFGILLAIRNQKQTVSPLYTPIVTALAGLAGIFHGHAYGESIFGAEPTPLIAYLIGFTLIQLAIAIGAYLIAQKISFKYLMRFTGGAIVGIGLTFFSTAVLGG